jgi:YidC/Oxa1 family membrane protein insertase
MLSLFVTSGATTIQSLLLQHHPIRRALDIPIVPREMQGKLPSFKETIQYCRQKLKGKSAEAAAQQRRNARRRP